MVLWQSLLLALLFVLVYALGYRLGKKGENKRVRRVIEDTRASTEHSVYMLRILDRIENAP